MASAATPYRLGSGDKLRIVTYGEADLTGEYQVSGGGAIAFPLIGAVQAGGLTVPELQSQIETTLRGGYLKDPRVSVEVINFRPFFILGEVARPNAYPYSEGLTVLNAVATAGGFSYRANKHKIYIKHAGESQERAVIVDSSTPVLPGDSIRVVERFF